MVKILLLLFVLLSEADLEELLCPSGCVCEMVQGLRSASCKNEQLTTIEAYIPPEVQFLDLSHNIIHQLNDYGFKDQNLDKLVVLNLSSNSINQISLRAFLKLDLLQIVDLSNNALQTIPEDVFETNSNLLKLFLGGNKFGFLEAKPILNSKSLQVLDLSYCGLSHLNTETFLKLPSLTSIDISQNFIINLNVKIFQNQKLLTYLKFSDNTIECNTDMLNLISFLTKQQVKFDDICKKNEEKFQKLINFEEPTEKSRILKWNFDNCDIETIGQSFNNTKCEIKEDNFKISVVLLVICTASGFLIGVSLSCLFFICFNTKNIKTKRKRRNIVRRRFQPTEEFLLRETNHLGMSTPVLNNIRRLQSNNFY